MSARNGQLLVVRKQITLVAGPQAVDTGLRQVNHASPVGEPDLAARTMVVPLVGSADAPGDWSTVRIVGEPVVGPNGTVLVTLAWLGGNQQSATFNVMFWAPHSSIGPVDADLYGALPQMVIT